MEAQDHSAAQQASEATPADWAKVRDLRLKRNAPQHPAT